MAIKRAKKLSKKEFENVKIIENRVSLIETETAELGKLKVEHFKKMLLAISSEFTPELALEIGKIELYIDKKKASLDTFTKETNRQNVLLAKDLQDKYGEGSINPEKGTFVPK